MRQVEALLNDCESNLREGDRVLGQVLEELQQLKADRGYAEMIPMFTVLQSVIRKDLESAQEWVALAELAPSRAMGATRPELNRQGASKTSPTVHPAKTAGWRRDANPARMAQRSAQVHATKERLETGMVAEVAEEERALDAVDCTRASLEGSFKAVDRSIGFAEAGVHVSEVVGRDEFARGPIAHLVEDLPCPLGVAPQCAGLTQLGEEQRRAG